MPDHLIRLFFTAALYFVATKLVHKLGREPQMCANRHAAVTQGPYRFGHPVGAFEFDHLGTGAHQFGRVVQRCCDGAITHEWHVRHDQCPAIALGDGADVIADLFQCNGKRTVMALQDHAKGVANENDIHTRFADQLGEGCVVRSQCRKGFTFCFAFPKGIDSDGHKILAFFVGSV